VTGEAPQGDPVDAAVDVLAAGGLVAFPTETVWGLAADAWQQAAVERLRAWKGRDEAQPLSVLVARPAALARLGLALPPAAGRLADALWPGPLTLVLPRAAPEGPGPPAPAWAPGVARADGAVGVRCSSHPVAAALAAEAERRGLGPPTATSLNRSGEPPAGRRAEALHLCAGPEAPFVMEVSSGEAYGDPPSTVVDGTRTPPVVLREGAVARERLAALSDDPPKTEEMRPR